MIEKKCVSCQLTLPLTEFNNNIKNKDGKQAYCKICQRQKKREHYNANKEKLLSDRKEWRKKNREKDRRSCSRWKQNNPEAYKAAYKKHNALRRKKVLLKISSELKCVRCGCDKFELLEINHKNGGGLREVGRQNQKFVSRILSGERSVEDLEILCKLCNILHYIEMKFGPQSYVLNWSPTDE